MDPLVYNMSHEDPGNVSYSEIGGLSEQIRELREVGSACFVSELSWREKGMKNYFVQIVVTEYYTFNILAEKNSTEFLAVKIICVC